MPKYEVLVNSNHQGFITCEDVESFVKETYPGVKHEVDHEERVVYLQVGILEAMRLANSVSKVDTREELNVKKFEVELSITQTFTTKVIVEGDFEGKNDLSITKAAELVADNMSHDDWNYNETEFEVDNVRPIPENLSSYHYDLLKCGYSLDMIKDYSVEDAEAELGAIADSL